MFAHAKIMRKIVMLVTVLLMTRCGALESPTEPRQTSCTNPATLNISVMPLHDPELFVMIIDRQYDVQDLVKRLQRHYELRNLHFLPIIHGIGAEVRPKDLEALRCEPGIILIKQSQSGSGGG